MNQSHDNRANISIGDFLKKIKGRPHIPRIFGQQIFALFFMDTKLGKWWGIDLGIPGRNYEYDKNTKFS